MKKKNTEGLCEGEIISSWGSSTFVSTKEAQIVEVMPLSDSEVLAQEVKREHPVKSKIKKILKRYFIDAFTGMAQGLFCTLIAGTIICTIAKYWIGLDFAIGKVFMTFGNIAKMLMGAGIGVGIAHKLGAKPLVIFTAAVTGLIGAWTYISQSSGIIPLLLGQCDPLTIGMGAPGNPIGSYVVALFSIEIARLYAGKTKLDIVLVPIGMIIVSVVAIWIAWPFVKLVEYIGIGIALAIKAGTALKIIVGVFVAVVMGILLTMPTSSAAIWITICGTLSDTEYGEALAIAGGAAVAGCAAHMIGFAVASFRENKWGGLISQGIGTSMLQIPNIMKKPIIMIPEIVASAVAGLVAVLLGLRCDSSGGGMGTSGFVGVIGTINASQNILDTWQIVVGIILCLFVIPAIVSLFVSEILRKAGLIKKGDQALSN